MEKTLHNLSDSIVGIRGGNVSAGVLDTVKVVYHGQQTPLKHIAFVSKKDHAITIDPYEVEFTNQIANNLKDMGFNAYAFSKTRVVVNVPPPSGDQKKEIISHLRKLGEDAKIAIRNIRKKHRQKLDKNALKTEDKKIQEVTDSYIAEVDEIINGKISSL
ncbi:MAG: ribosome-recycling factor [Crenarchaeota archaeon]|nr:MAG: ribosome-recycling factor [Thermoproteota archaeon]